MKPEFLEPIRYICDHLTERTATLFLGAGINAGVKSNSGQACPLAADLSHWICNDLLSTSELDIALDEAVEIARYKLGEKALNDYLFDRFKEFRAGTAQLALIQLPWDVIYTTNFDLLVEEAATSKAIQPAGTIRVVLATTTDLSKFTESDILYYKLHGSLDVANTPAGRLILTKADYRVYERHKKPLFRRLKADLLSRTFLFAGYSLSDPKFQGDS